MQIPSTTAATTPATLPKPQSLGSTPGAILGLQFKFLSPAEIIRTGQVCKRFQSIIFEDSFIKEITANFEAHFPSISRKFKRFLGSQVKLKKEEATSLMFQLYDSFYRIERNLCAEKYVALCSGPFEGFFYGFINSRYLLSLIHSDIHGEFPRGGMNLIDLAKQQSVSKMPRYVFDSYKASGDVVGWYEATRSFLTQSFFVTQAERGKILSTTNSWIITGDSEGSLFVWDRQGSDKLLVKLPKAIRMTTSYEYDSDDEGRPHEITSFSGQITVDEPSGRIAIFDEQLANSLTVWDIHSQTRLLAISLTEAKKFNLVNNHGDGDDDWRTNFCFHGKYLRSKDKNSKFLHVPDQKTVSFKAQEGVKIIAILPEYALTLLDGSLYLENLFESGIQRLDLKIEVKACYHLGGDAVLIQDATHHLYVFDCEHLHAKPFPDPAKPSFDLNAEIQKFSVLDKDKYLLLTEDEKVYFLDFGLKKIFALKPEKPINFRVSIEPRFVDNCLFLIEGCEFAEGGRSRSGYKVHSFDFLPGKNPEQILNSKRIANHVEEDEKLDKEEEKVDFDDDCDYFDPRL